MTSDQRFAILTTLLGALAIGVGSIIIVAINDHFSLRALLRDVEKLVNNKEQTHREIITQMNEFHRELVNQMHEERTATNERLQYLERQRRS